MRFNHEPADIADPSKLAEKAPERRRRWGDLIIESQKSEKEGGVKRKGGDKRVT